VSPQLPQSYAKQEYAIDEIACCTGKPLPAMLRLKNLPKEHQERQEMSVKPRSGHKFLAPSALFCIAEIDKKLDTSTAFEKVSQDK